MTYTIRKFAEKIEVNVTTLRYYDKEGLLPFVDKKPDGTRVFKDEDLQELEVITCMKNSGMPIKDIKKYMDLCQEGTSTLKERLEIFFKERKLLKSR